MDNNLEKENTEQAALIAELQEKLAASESRPAAGLPRVKVDKVEYEFTAPSFQYNGKVYAAAEAKEDKKLLAELVKIGAGVLKEVEVKEEA